MEIAEKSVKFPWQWKGRHANEREKDALVSATSDWLFFHDCTFHSLTNCIPSVHLCLFLGYPAPLLPASTAFLLESDGQLHWEKWCISLALWAGEVAIERRAWAWSILKLTLQKQLQQAWCVSMATIPSNGDCCVLWPWLYFEFFDSPLAHSAYICVHESCGSVHTAGMKRFGMDAVWLSSRMENVWSNQFGMRWVWWGCGGGGGGSRLPGIFTRCSV